MREIFLVKGESGIYDDYTTWIECAYESEATAEKHVADANKKEETRERTVFENKAEYFVERIELRTEVPPFSEL